MFLRRDKQLKYIKELHDLGFKIFATKGTADFLKTHGLNCKKLKKFIEGSPNIVDYMNQGKIDLIFNTTEGSQAIKDSFTLRRAAINNKIPYYTTMAGSRAMVEAIKTMSIKDLKVSSLQKFYKKKEIRTFY